MKYCVHRFFRFSQAVNFYGNEKKKQQLWILITTCYLGYVTII